MATTQTELAIIDIRGVVQGVGFRPFVYQLASRHKLNGWVRNTSEGVSIEIEGARAILDRFVIELREQAPPMARIESLTAAFQEPSGYQKFEIRDSISEQGKYQLISPDIATCHECLADIIDRQNRRFHYPFTNCTNCGPAGRDLPSSKISPMTGRRQRCAISSCVLNANRNMKTLRTGASMHSRTPALHADRSSNCSMQQDTSSPATTPLRKAVHYSMIKQS